MTCDRRCFLRDSVVLGGAAVGAPVLTHCAKRSTPDVPSAFSADELRTLSALVEHVLPSDDEPGAREAGCAAYIYIQLALPEFQAVLKMFQRGIQMVEAKARQRGVDGFPILDLAARDEVLRDLERLRTRGFSGPHFLHRLVVMTLEGFLCDPRHGGNRGGVGWRFARHEHVRWAPGDGRAWTTTRRETSATQAGDEFKR